MSPSSLGDHLELPPLGILDTLSNGVLLIWILYSITTGSLLLYRSRRSDGQIKLPHRQPVPPGSNRRVALYSNLLDHLATDLHDDGEAVDEARFWRKTRLQRLIVSSLVGLLVSLQIYRGRDILGHTSSSWPYLSFIAQCVCIGWMLVLAAILASSYSLDIYKHALQSMFLTSALLTVRLYLEFIEKYISLDLVTINPRLAGISLAISVISTVIIGSITQEPEKYRDRTRLYNEAVSMKLKEIGGEKFEGNVVGTGRSILGRFLSLHMFRTVHDILPRDQVDLHELPVLPGNMQTESTTRCATESDAKSRLNGHMSTVSLIWSTMMTQRGNLISTMLCIIFERLVAYLPYLCLERILSVLDGSGPKRMAWAYASIFVISKKAENITTVFRMWDLGMFHVLRGLETHLSFLLFRKLLTRNVFSVGKTSGKGDSKALTKPDILNLVSSDIQQLENFVWTAGSILELLLSSAIGCVFIWYLLRVSAAWGIAFSFLAYPPAYLLSKWELSLFDKSRGASDERIAATQETVQAISMIKMSGYERHTFERLNTLRQKEFKYQFWGRVVGFVSAAVYSAAPALVIVIIFGHFTLVRHQTLTASLAFTSIGVFAELRPALTMAPRHVADLLKQVLAARRIQRFLQTEDVEHLNASDDDVNIAKPSDKAMTVVADVTWHQQDTHPGNMTENVESPVFALRNLDIAFKRGKITLVAGKAGSGKTVLLLALLGEVKVLRGSITYAVSPVLDPDQMDEDMSWATLGNGVAYVPQVAWLQSLNIRENILFGLPMNEDRYKWVLKSCALIPDLRLLEDGDLTEIGERGKTLSGGQKARVSLARAMYSRASVLILDDVLSAVDASTGRHIVDNCFLAPEMADRTIIIASHAVEAVAPISHEAIFLEDGTSVWQGTGSDLLESDHVEHLRTAKSPNNSDETSLADSASGDHRVSQTKGESHEESTDFEILRAPAKTPRQMLVDEKRAHGVVEAHYWLDLIKMCGGRLFLATFVLLTIGSIMGPVAERALIQAWTERVGTAEPTSWVLAYAALSTVIISLSVGQELAGFYGGYRAMKLSFVRMLDSVLRAPMQFFIRTRAGSIIQRFSGDLDMVVDCAELVGNSTLAVGQATVSVVSITWFAGWRFALAVILMVLVFYKPAQNYRVASRQVRRLKAILPGPVNAHFAETLSGAPVIRAFGAQGLHVRHLLRISNMAQTSTMLGYMIGRWMWIQVELFDFGVLSAALSLILTTPGMTGAKAGFIMGFAQTIAAEFDEFVVCAREFDLKGVTLERLAEYTELETEDIPSFIKGEEDSALAARSALIDDTWPQTGRIEVNGLHARYASDFPDVLSDISFKVCAGERIGIVGATGCGKSSLAKAFFSFIEISKGNIEIDGKDLSSLPVDIARGRLGIIGQDPMLVTGSLRLNLDIESSHCDEALLAVLRRIELLDQTVQVTSKTGSQSEESSVTVVEDAGASKNRNVFEDLDFRILNAGENLSAGEKQLVVLARALLQKKKVLILDEATASIDTKTDMVVTRLIHGEFDGSTILIIAHRLRVSPQIFWEEYFAESRSTIMPCDRIMVMDKGRIVQFDSPDALLDLGEGAFFDLCMAAGVAEFRQLRAMINADIQ